MALLPFDELPPQLSSKDDSGGHSTVVAQPKDGEWCNGEEESCLVNGCEAHHLIFQKSVVVIRAANDGGEDGGQNDDER